MKNMNRILWATAVLLATVALTPSQMFAAERSSVEPRAIIIEPPGERNFRVRVDTDRNTYYPGDRIRVIFSASRDARVYIFNTDTEGKTRQIFPNYYDRNNLVRAGREYSIPDSDYTLRVTGPAGSERLRIVAYSTHWKALRSWDDFRRTDPFPSRSLSPESMRERVKREAISQGKPEVRVEDRRSMRIIEVPDNYGYAEDTAYFTVRREEPYRGGDWYSGWDRYRDDRRYRPYQPWSRYDYDYYRPPIGPYEPDPKLATARIRVYSSPDQADVYIDGLYRGRTPGTFRVEPGRREVLVYHPDHGSRSSEISLKSGSSSSISLSLGPRR